MVKSELGDVHAFKEYLMKKGLAQSTVHIYGETLKTFFKRNPNIDTVDDYNYFLIETSIKKRQYQNYYVLRNYISMKITDAARKASIFAAMIKIPPREDIVMERKHLTLPQLLEVINNLKQEKHRVIAMICMITGVRIGDIMKLKRIPECITPEEYEGKVVLKLALVGKRKKRNVVYIHDKIIIDIIMHYIINNFGFRDYYFLNRSVYKNIKELENDHALYKNNYYYFYLDLKQALAKADFDFGDFATHDFRRCFSRRAWEKYKDVNILQNLLMHGDPKTTMRYLKQSGMQNIDYHKAMQEEI